ncbi:transmembrane protein 131 isoform X1 [Ictalurus punctatus]|uniref:Transmembrane protein 131 isoform X1 n=2 Tax=Ictalurus punctatus TaxID=7998 RepID=A0A2D0RXV1_ICTPU|nr:transmembrane protein 131 isoform X1 [Ictalurus punctatus]
MASEEGIQSFSHLPRTKSSPTSCIGCILRVLFIAVIHMAHANKQAFIQSNKILEVLHFGDGAFLQAESDLDLSSYHQKSSSSHRGNSRPIHFEPPMLDFHEQPVGMPKMEKVYLHNPSSEEISLISISATTAHFHASFFQSRIIPPGGNTSFDVVFLARVVGNVENTLFINTSHHGVFTYQVFGVGIPNPYRLRPFVGARVPVNSSFSPLINIFNPHSEPLQVVEMYSSGGDLHLELPTGQQGGTKKLWEIAPFETKGVMRASFSSRDADNHTAFIRIKTNASNEDEFIILPVEVEVTTAPGIYSSTEMLDFGTLRSQDRPKQLNLHLLNSGAKDVSIMSVRPTPANEAVTVEFKQVTLKAGESRYTKVASINFDASKARRPDQFSGKITVKAKEKSYSKLEIPFQAEVLEGYLGFDHTATLFHIRDSPVDPVDRPIYLTNTFNFAIRIHNVSLPDDAKMFNVHNFSTPVLILPHESRYIFSLLFRPVRPSIHIDSNILLITNASKFHLPVRAYTGFLEPVVVSSSSKENILDYGILSATDTSSLVFVVVNNNPIELEIKSWMVTGDSLSMELLTTEKGNRSVALSRVGELQNTSVAHYKTVILASGYYAAFKVTLIAKALEGVYDGAVHITTDYEILTIPVKALIAVGTLSCSPKHIIMPPSFPGKVVHQGLSIQSTFSQRVRLQQILSLTEDVRFYYKRLRSNRVELEPRRKTKIANIYFDASLQCGDHCYVGLPFVLKTETKPHIPAMLEDICESDVDLHQRLLRRWKELKEQSGLEFESFFEVNTDLQKKVQAKISAQLTWPSLINSSQQILFPLTNINSSSVEEIILENPADVPVYVQVFPVALYPNPSAFTEIVEDRFPNEKMSNINTSTLEFEVQQNQSSLVSSTGSAEDLIRKIVFNVLIVPGESKSLTVRFSPISNHSVSSLLVIRNNLTVVDLIMVHGQGTRESLKLAGKHPGPGSSLRFKMTEALLKDCSENKPKEPNFTLRKTFRLENTGLLPIHIRSTEISGTTCEGYGFKVLNCQEFALKPNTSKDLIILFTPDFTSSRVIRELKLVSAGGSEFAFVLNASLPYHMLAACVETIPPPNWELELYIIVSLFMSSMFLLVIATAYLEAQGIWEPFKRCLSVESNSPMETGKPFDLREIVRIQSDANLNDFADSHQNSNRGAYGSGGSGRAGGRQGGLHSSSNGSAVLGDSKSRGSSGRSSMQASSPSSSQLIKDGSSALNQLTYRKPRNSKQQQQQQQQPPQQLQQQLQQTSNPLEELQNLSTTLPSQSHRAQSTEEQDYNRLLVAMDKDLDRPESPAINTLMEQSIQQSVQNKGKTKNKMKAPKKKEEKERKGRGKTQGEELKEALADNDDSSSTTTETSNPDTESNIKEEPVKKKVRIVSVEKEREEVPPSPTKPKTKKQSTTKKENQVEKSSSLELPYVTPLENKQRKTFPKTVINTGTQNVSKPRPPQKQRLPGGKLEEGRPSPLAKFNGFMQDFSSGSEGEKESPPPEWDVPLKVSSQADSLQQISLQTMNADLFLKRPTSAISRTSPPPTSPTLINRSSYSSVLNTSSEVTSKKAPGNKLVKSTSLPGQNGNPTFAAVAAGYDKSPGGSGSGKAECLGKAALPHMTSVESDSSDNSGLWSPVENMSSTGYTSINSFSTFGPHNPLNLTTVFSDIAGPKNSEHQSTWPEYTHVPSSIWDTERSNPWPTSSGSPTTPTTTILGKSRNPWSPSLSFSNSIWSTGPDSTLHSSPITDLVSHTAPATPAPTDLGHTYNPWNGWPPSLSRWNSDPWPSNPDSNNTN